MNWLAHRSKSIFMHVCADKDIHLVANYCNACCSVALIFHQCKNDEHEHTRWRLCVVFYDSSNVRHHKRSIKKSHTRDKTTRTLSRNRVDGWINKEFIAVRISCSTLHEPHHLFDTLLLWCKMRKLKNEKNGKREYRHHFAHVQTILLVEIVMGICTVEPLLLNIFHGLFKLQFIFIRSEVRRRRRRCARWQFPLDSTICTTVPSLRSRGAGSLPLPVFLCLKSIDLIFRKPYFSLSFLLYYFRKKAAQILTNGTFPSNEFISLRFWYAICRTMEVF